MGARAHTLFNTERTQTRANHLLTQYRFNFRRQCAGTFPAALASGARLRSILEQRQSTVAVVIKHVVVHLYFGGATRTR